MLTTLRNSLKRVRSARYFSQQNSKLAEEGPGLKDFIKSSSDIAPEEEETDLPAYLHINRAENASKTYFIETHGC